jgi:sugar/nucleoside kinase (ribokinase family)
MARRFDLVVVGEINPDVIVGDRHAVPVYGQVETLVDSIRLTLGSSSAIFACGAARLGLRTAFVGIVGADPFGRFALDALREHGVDTSACRTDPARPTGATVILSRGDDRAILTAMGTIDALRAEDVPRDLLAEARHLHVGSTYLQHALRPGLPALFADARAAGLTVSFDCNWDPSGAWDGGIDGLLGGADLFLPNGAEIRAITGIDDDRAAAAALIRRYARGLTAGDLTVAVKRGPDGGLAVREGVAVEAAALSVGVLDTTGAGDSFDAGMVYGFLAGWSLEASLELAVACGSLSVRATGGTEGQPTLAEARAGLVAAGRVELPAEPR